MRSTLIIISLFVLVVAVLSAPRRSNKNGFGSSDHHESQESNGSTHEPHTFSGSPHTDGTRHTDNITHQPHSENHRPNKSRGHNH